MASPVSMCLKSIPESVSSGIRDKMLSPSIYAIEGLNPTFSAISATASAQLAGSSPPALLITFIFFSIHVAITCSI